VSRCVATISISGYPVIEIAPELFWRDTHRWEDRVIAIGKPARLVEIISQ
jgi:hypothetical protein